MKKLLFIVLVFFCALSTNAQTIMEEIYLRDRCSSDSWIFGGYTSGMYDQCPFMEYDSHDLFGKRSIDLMSDLWSGDIALQKNGFGWFSSDANLNMSSRRFTLWFYYYRWLYAVNNTIVYIQTMSPSDKIGYAQLLAYRGYIYSCLANFFGERTDEAPCCPIYTEDNYTVRYDHFATRKEVYEQAVADLEKAISIFEQEDYIRSSKFEIDREVACGLLAQACLNAAVGSEQQTIYLQKALTNAKKVIDSGKYTILPKSDLITNGFNNVESTNWIWGIDIDTISTGSLKSFWGQVDIFTYSYANAGDVKGIDANLFASIPDWDARKNWFLTANVESAVPADQRNKFLYAPVNKFFSVNNHTVVNFNDLEKKWLSDDVYMRIEALYLIASEAAWRLGDLTTAKIYLKELTDKRVEEGKDEAYNTAVAMWSSAEEIKQQIIHNWRIEMWGEGYAYETMRRWKHARVRGINHFFQPSVTISANDISTKFTMPYPYLMDTLGNELKDANGEKIIHATGEEITINISSTACEHPLTSINAMAGDYLWLGMEEGWLTENFSYWELATNGETYTSREPQITARMTHNASFIAHFGESEDIQSLDVPKNEGNKVLQNNQLYILRGDKVYTVTGQEVK